MNFYGKYRTILEVDSEYSKKIESAKVIPDKAKVILRDLAKYGFYYEYFSIDDGIKLKKIRYNVGHSSPADIDFTHEKIITNVFIKYNCEINSIYIEIYNNVYRYSDDNEYYYFDDKNKNIYEKVEGAKILSNCILTDLLELKIFFEDYWYEYYNKEL